MRAIAEKGWNSNPDLLLIPFFSRLQKVSSAPVDETGSSDQSTALPPLRVLQAEPLDVALLDSPVHTGS